MDSVNPETNLLSEDVALEKYQYTTFVQQKTAYSRSQLGHRMVPLSTLELPNNSVLHLIDKLLVPNEETHATNFKISPDITNPLITNERYMKYLHHWFLLADNNTPVFPVSKREHPQYRPLHFSSESRNFFFIHKEIKRIPSLEAILGRDNVLSIINYNALLSVMVPGRFAGMRKFDIIFRSLLASLNDISGKHQFLEIPLSNRVYARQKFVPAFEKLDPSTIKIFDDYSYFVMIHLLGLFRDGPSTSLFKLFPVEKLDEINLIFTAHGHGVIYNLGTLLRLGGGDQLFALMLRHLTTLKLLNEVTPDQVAALDDKKFDQLSEDKEKQTAEQPVIAQPTSVAPVQQTTTPVEAPPVVVVATPIIPKQEPVSKKKEPETLIEVIDRSARQHIEQHPLTQMVEKKTRAVATSERYKDVMINGHRIGDLLADTQPVEVPVARLDFIEDSLSDPSMAQSTIAQFDQLYLEKVHARDTAAVLSSFNKNGMFLIDCEETIENTPLNRSKHYKTTYEDVTGKRHRVAFSFPIIDDQGTMLSNSITSRMSKQQVNLPICKVSPTRVSLRSSYNNALVERVTTRAHNFGVYLAKLIGIILTETKDLKVVYGNLSTKVKLPYDYSMIAQRYIGLTFSGYKLTFNYEHRFDDADDVPKLQEYEGKYGIYCGTVSCLTTMCDADPSGTYLYKLFYGMDNQIHFIGPNRGMTPLTTSMAISEILIRTFGDKVPLPRKVPSEWTELKIKDKNFPLIFVLGFQYGLKYVLDRIGLKYTFIPKGERHQAGPTEIFIPFSDGILWFDRYPLETSLIAAGLLKFKLFKYNFESFNSQDVYYTILQDVGMSMNYLKGISGYFNFFVDPITREVLLHMKEPTDPGLLLIRANQMLSTTDAIPASSLENHRIRGYERLNSTLYNVVSRALEAYQNQKGTRRPFSININDVYQKIMQDPTVASIEEINPMNDLKSKMAITYSGQGGRTAQSFVISDRIYPDDAVGIMAETTLDSGKVAINAYTTVNPKIVNIRGMYDTSTDKPLEPAQMLSSTSLLTPFATHDSAARAI